MAESGAGPRIGVFSVHGISRHDPLRMAADVTDGIYGWLRARTGTAWGCRFEDAVERRRRRRALPRYVLECDDPGAPTIAVCESNWSDVNRGAFRPHTLRQWVRNTVATAGGATRGLNRKTQFELLFVLIPLVTLAMTGFAIFGFIADTSQRAGVAVILFLLFVALGLCSFFASLVVPFVPRVRRRLRIFSEELQRHAAMPAGVRHIAALFEMNAAPSSDPSNIVLAFTSMIRGTVGSAAWFAAAYVYAWLVLGPAGLQALRRVTVADWIAFVVLAAGLRFGLAALPRIKDAYEPLEDIYAYADPGPKARNNRNKVVRTVTSDLKSFLAATPFDAVVLTGHSLGSVLLLDAIAEIQRDIASDCYDSRHLATVCAVVMYGSPFTKIHTQIRALDPRRFPTELLRVATVLRLLSLAAGDDGLAVCHNVYYLTDVVAEKIITKDDSIANHMLRSPLRPWSHGSYHTDHAFWSVVFDAANCGMLFAPGPQAPALHDDAARFDVPSRWPAPTWQQSVLGLAKLGMLALILRFVTVALDHGANPTITLVLLLVFVTAVTLTIKD